MGLNHTFDHCLIAPSHVFGGISTTCQLEQCNLAYQLLLEACSI
jgi:hypothetical protein